MADMTPDEIAEARRIIEAATKGPWQQFDDGGCTLAGLHAYGPRYAPCVWGPEGPGHGLIADFREGGAASLAEQIANAKFAAAARTGWPKALDEIERLRAGNQRLKQTGLHAINDIGSMAVDQAVAAHAAEAERDDAVKMLSHLKDEFDIRIIPHIREGKYGLAVSLCKAISASIDAFLATQPKPEGENP